MNITEDQLKATILDRMARHTYWGGRHTSIDNLQKGIPRHLAKDVKNAAKELIKDGFLLSKPTAYGLQVSLNPRMAEEIKDFIRRYLP